ncbi:aldo/keto reductase [Streptomyces huiliensis]|uniref:aldo/keto reductase n=1 Tax=Streptomyces huiliensis TaxID=2876027 RepID=UPI001CBEAE2F|nr:aldo/keto reductase [Streptomyces huiliensis]MBZ4322378.1 aldo/keto reductase [Streptomyces huiliensis]
MQQNTAQTTAHNTATTHAIGGDLVVPRLGYGAMRLAGRPDERHGVTAPIWTAPTDRTDAIALLRRAVELGIRLFDTADAYALGENEELVAEALRPFAGDVVIATKVGVVRPSPTEWVTHGHPAYLRQQAELSLRRLGTDRIDLLQLHRIDPAYPAADQIGALKQLQDEGKVRHIGLSEVTVEQVREASAIVPVHTVQNLYNLGERGHDPVIDHATEHGIAFLPFWPIAMGEHAGPDSPVAEVARELGATPAQTALAWLLHRSPAMIPIPGTSSPAHLAENWDALGLSLSPEQYARIDLATAPKTPAS